MEPAVLHAQRDVCARAGVIPDPPVPGSTMGIGPMRGSPINGLRHPGSRETCGWYVWAGGPIDQQDPSFFSSLHVGHLGDLHPEVLPYLALPPGWRFLFAPGYEDVWYDASLLDVE